MEHIVKGGSFQHLMTLKKLQGHLVSFQGQIKIVEIFNFFHEKCVKYRCP